MNEEEARRLGEKLLAEVEIVDLSSVLKSLREFRPARCESTDDDEVISNSCFGIPELDALVPPSPTVLELVSPPPAHHPSGAGKTSLLYLIIAQAILPVSFNSSVTLGGQNAAVILLDPLNHFSVTRLASITLNLLKSRLSAADIPLDSTIKSELKQTLKTSLLHLHILRPQSWPSLLITLRSLPEYLFDSSRHKSTHRRIHSIILEDSDTFVSSIRNPALHTAKTSPSNPLSTASTQLTTQLAKLTSLFSCHVILTSHSVLPSVFRPALPTSWPHGGSVTRLAVRRVEVIKFTPGISVEDAEVERQQRWDVISKGRFECWKVGAGIKRAEGFVFRVGAVGVEVEKAEV